MPPRKPPKKAPAEPSKFPKKTQPLLEFYPHRDGDPYYRNVETPLEFLLLTMRDERQPLGMRFAAAMAAAPYCHARVAPKPYLPTPEERRVLEEQNRLTIEIVEFKEISRP